MRVEYKDVVDPYVRAEEEALRRGFWQGVATSVWLLMCACVIGMLLWSLKANAAEWWMSETWAPIKASACGGVITVCSNNASEGQWTCFCVK